MKKVLVVLYESFPDPSPNTNCLRAIMEGLGSDHEFHVLASRRTMDEQSTGTMNGIAVFKADDRICLVRDWCRRGLSGVIPKPVAWFLRKAVLAGLRVIDCFSWPDYSYGWRGNATRLAVRLHSRHGYDAVVSVCYPFSAVLVGQCLKRLTGVKWVIYQLDPFSGNVCLNNALGGKPVHNVKRNLEAEDRAFADADAIALTSELARTYVEPGSPFVGHACKFHDIGVPLLEPITGNRGLQTPDREPNRKTGIVYAGRMYKDIRNPGYAMELIRRCNLVSDRFVLHLFGSLGDCSDLVGKYKALMGESLVVHGTIDHRTMLQNLCDADILLNIGNTVRNQVPSKILEYMGTGKPIVNVYSIEGDTSGFYLEGYALHLSIREDWSLMDDNVERFIRFCGSTSGKRIPFEELLASPLARYTPANASERFRGLLGDIGVGNESSTMQI